MTHGTETGWRRHGCRCDLCEAAHRVELGKARERKERYRGTCGECGGPTTGSYGVEKAPTTCGRCDVGSGRLAAVAYAKRGTGDVGAAAISLLRERPMRFTELAAELGITRGHMSVLQHRLRRYGLIERVSRGVYRAAA